MKTTLERFMEKVSPEALTGCWLWTGAVDQHGYGCMTVNRTNIRAHRYAAQTLGGANIEGLGVLHHCDTPACVNPAHLFTGTQQDNTDDMFAKGREPVRWKTHCKRGHELSGDNVYPWKSGKGRSCRACACVLAREYRAQKPKQPAKPLARFCGKGHEFTPENTYIPQGRNRRCKACASLISKRYDAKRRSTTKEKSK